MYITDGKKPFLLADSKRKNYFQKLMKKIF